MSGAPPKFRASVRNESRFREHAKDSNAADDEFEAKRERLKKRLRKGTMKKVVWTGLLPAILALVFVAGCSRNPNVLKQKYLESGNRFFEKQQYREAAIQYENAIQIDPKYVNAHYRLALCFLHLSDWNGAYAELNRTTDLSPDDADAQLDLGNLLLGQRRYQEAQDRADLVLTGDPRNVKARILRANALAELQNMDASLQEMQTAIDLDPQRASSYLNMALLHTSAKQTAAAEEDFQKALSMDPKSLAARLGLGNIYSEEQRWSEAEAQFRQAIEQEPQNLVPRISLCNVFLAENQRSQAEKVAADAKEALKSSAEGYRVLGDFYFRVGDIPKALQEYASLYKDHPKDLRVKKNYIQLLILQGHLAEANTLNQDILKANEKDQDSQLFRAQILVQQGRPGDATGLLEAAIKNEPSNAAAHYYLGLAFAATGNPEQAQAEWRETVGLDPNLVEAQSALAAAALKKGDPLDLRAAAEAIIGARPKLPDGYVLRAIAEVSTKDQSAAEVDLNRAIQVAPQNFVGYTHLAEFRALQKKYAEAERLYSQALALNSNSTEALQGLVAVLIEEKQTDKALAKVDEMISRAPETGAYYLLRANLLTGTKPPQYDQAEAALLKASDLNRSDATALISLSQLYVNRGSTEKAVTSLQEGIQRDPKNAQAYLLLGALEERQQNWQKAQELYQKALELQPDFPLASNNLAYLMLEHGENIDVALSLAQTARQKLPDNPGVADTLAWAYFKKGTYKLSIELLEEAIKKLDDPSFHYHLGLAYQKIDDKPRAKMQLEHVLRVNPTFEHAGDIKNALAALGRG